MAKLLDTFIKDNRRFFEKRQIGRIGSVQRKTEQLVKDICQWHKIDDEGDISISSTVAPNFDIDSNQQAQKLADYQTNVKTQLANIKELFQGIIEIENRKNLNAKHSQKIKASSRLKALLANLENHISKDVHRTLRNRRRKEMKIACRLERVENKVKVHNFTTLHIDIDLIHLLEKGPNHIPKKTIPIYQRANVCKDHLINVLQQITYSTKNMHPKLTPLGLELNKTSLPIETINDTMVNIDIINEYLSDIPKPDGTEEKDETLQKLHKLAKDDRYIVNCADKNLGFVINSTEWYKNELDRQLSDISTYIKIENVESNQQLIDISKRNLNELITELKKCVSKMTNSHHCAMRLLLISPYLPSTFSQKSTN